MRGFTLPEVLVAMLIAMVVSGALFLVIQPIQGLYQSQLESADLQQRLRIAVDTMARDLIMAGAGETAGTRTGPLSGHEAPVMPYRRGVVNDDPQANVFYRPDTITIRYVASTAAQPVVTSRTYYLRPDSATQAFQLMRYDGDHGDFPMVDNVVLLAFDYAGDPRPPRSIPAPDAGTDADTADEYGAGENCLFVRSAAGEATPRLPALAAGAAPVPLGASLLTDGPWCPSAASPERFDADLLRVRRIGVRIRVQVGQPGLRGPAGPLFFRAGSATTAERYVPDRDIRVEVAPRNLDVPR